MKKNFRIWMYSFVLVGTFLMFTTTNCKKDGDNDPGLTDIDDNIDIDGNVYNTVNIGTQIWMVENLKTTRYRNGDSISNVTSNSVWATLTKGAQCSFNNNEANGNKYGKLYNWYAVKDSRKLAPTGWHIPTDAEWSTLANYVAANLGTASSLAKALAANTDWASSSMPGAVGNDLTKNNTSGFTALPGGFRGLNGPSGYFAWFGSDGCWWSSTEVDVSFATSRSLSSSSISNIQSGMFYKTDGLSVRCIKD